MICMFVGFPPNHACYVYVILNTKTNHVMRLRDIIWLSQHYGAWKLKNQVNENEVQYDNEEEAMGIEYGGRVMQEDKKASKSKTI